MAPRIDVPLDVHLLTLRVETLREVQVPIQVGRETQMQRRRVRDVTDVPHGLDRTALAQAVDASNRIFRPADIQFAIRSCANETADAPGNRPEVDPAGFFDLARQFPARAGVSVLVVNRFHGPDLGGEAVESLSACILRRLDPLALGKVLAHELGHLLNLPHVTRSGRDNYNLMWPGLRADDLLTDEQIRAARTSPLVRRLGR